MKLIKFEQDNCPICMMQNKIWEKVPLLMQPTVINISKPENKIYIEMFNLTKVPTTILVKDKIFPENVIEKWEGKVTSNIVNEAIINNK